MSRAWKFRIVFFLLSLLLVVQHQACSPVQFKNLIIEDSSSKMDSGNGYGYGGKVIQQYHHFVPGFKCQSRDVSQSRIEIFETFTLFTENSFNRCHDLQIIVGPGLLERSPLQDQIIGFNGNIFEQTKEIPLRVPPVLTETWCQISSNNDIQSEFLIAYDIEKQAVSAQILQGQSQSALVLNESADNIFREVSETSIKYVIGQNTTLFVDKKTPYPLFPGQFLGQIQTDKLDSQIRTYEARCYLGGLLDSRIWPAQIIADGNVTQFALDQGTNQAFILEKAKRGSPGATLTQDQFGTLSRWDYAAGDIMQSSLVRMVEGGADFGVRDFQIFEKGNYIGLRGKLPNGHEQVFSLNRLTHQMTQLNATAVVERQRPSSMLIAGDTFRLSQNGEYLFYVDGTHDNSPYGADIEPLLYRVPIAGGGLLKPIIDPKIFKTVDWEALSNIDLDNGNQVFYLGGFTKPKLYMHNLLNGEMQQVQSPLSTDWFFDVSSKLEVIDDENFFVVAETRYNQLDPDALKFMLLVYEKSGKLKNKFPIYGSKPKLSPEKKWFYSSPTRTIQKPNLDRAKLDIISVQTGAQYSIEMSVETNWEFTADEKGLLFLDLAHRRIVLQDLASNTKSDLCVSQLKSIEIADALIRTSNVSGESQLQVLVVDRNQRGSVFSVSEKDNTCILKNTFLLQRDSTFELLNGHNKNFLLLKESQFDMRNWTNKHQLKVIPLNGQAPITLSDTILPGVETLVSAVYIAKPNIVVLWMKNSFTGTQKIYRVELQNE